MKKKIRVATIGLGMGSYHVRGFQSHPNAEVVAIADANAECLNKKGKELGVPSLYLDAYEMLEKEMLDVVSVATPNKFHKPLVIAALKAGCHVLCEKPMAMNAMEAQDMLIAAKENMKRLMINFSFRFTEQAQFMKRQLEAGALGEIYFARSIWLRRRGMPNFGGWFGQKALSGGGPLIDLGVHRLDLALWLMGYPKPTWVMASTYDHIASAIAKRDKKDFDVEDIAIAMIKFENGATLELEASWAANIKENDLMETRLLGTKGGCLDDELFLENDGCLFDMKLHPPVPDCVSSYYHFIESILTNKPHLATGEEGVVVMELLDAIYKSAANGVPVQIN